MNIQPIGVSNQTNFKKQNVAFGNYTSSITEESLMKSMAFVNRTTGINLADEGLKSIAKKLWNTLEELKATYSEDKVVDVHTFIDSFDHKLWASVGPSKEVKSKQMLDGAGQHNMKLCPEFIISYGAKIKEEITTHAAELREKFAN